MLDLIIRRGHVVDPKNSIDTVCDIGIEAGKVVQIAEEISEVAKETLNAGGKFVLPGVIDMHTHMRTELGHPHAQRMVALAGVCTTFDLAGPLDNILNSIPGSGAGINVAILEAARAPQTISCNRPSIEEQANLVEKTVEKGGLGIKLLGGHFPMDLDVCQSFIEVCNEKDAWVAWHVGNSKHGSNIEGLRDAVEVSKNKFLHIAHVNSYCRSQVSNEVDESLEAIQLLNNNPNLFSESYLSPLNGTRLIIENNTPLSKVTVTCLEKVGCSPDYNGMKEAILKGKASVLYDNGTIGTLITGKEGFEYWEKMGTKTTGCFAVNPATSRFLLATAKRKEGSFVVDSFSTDGGCYPRNVIVENGLLLVKFGALTMSEFVVKSSLNGARALGLVDKGHLGVGADADVTVIDLKGEKAVATIVNGKVVMKEGKILGKGTRIICDERGVNFLKAQNIPYTVRERRSERKIMDRFIP